jgi:outer membrane protein assembly factor BamB
MRRRVMAVSLIAVALTLGVPVGGTAREASGPGCQAGPHPSGDWPSLNADLGNSRHQPLERSIDSASVGRLRAAWSFNGASVGATGGMRSTPVIAHGCVYAGFGQGYLGDRGDVVALDAETGELIWHARLDGSVLGLSVANGMVYAATSDGTRGDIVLPVVTDAYEPAGSHAVALDARTGALRWRSDRLDDGNAANGTFVNATPVVFEAGGRPLVFVPMAGGAGDGARVPMYFLDALSGRTVARSLTLTDAEYAEGFGGTGIWATAAYDPVGQHLYAGTADSDGRTRQHPYNNAILRIDANPDRPTFGRVVGSYGGTSEHLDLDPLIGYPRNPLCNAALGTTALELPTFFDTSASLECLELDLDFGASPNLHTAPDGRLQVTALQKSGVFHAVDATRMRAAWRAFLGPGGPAMHSGTAAVAGGRIVVGATPNLVFELDQRTGRVGWLSTTGVDVFAYQPVSVANGVVYAINDLGALVALDAATGRPLLHRLIAGDGGFGQCLGVGAGVAVAHGTVFAPCDAGALPDLAGLPAPPGGVVAYRLP